MSAYVAILSAIKLRHPQEEPNNRKFKHLTDTSHHNLPLRPVPSVLSALSMPYPAGRDTEQYYSQHAPRNPGY